MTDQNKSQYDSEDHARLVEQVLAKKVSPSYFPSESAHSTYKTIRFLEGPADIGSEEAILASVDQELRQAFSVFGELGPCVTFFGSARTKPTDPYYDVCRRTASLVAKEGFTIMTGGGPGMMQAANQGASEAGGRSMGATIELEHEESANPYVNREVPFKHFFIRKVVLVKYSYGFVVMPGGVGTLDELSEILTLIQCKKIRQFPVVLMGVDFWSGLVDFMSKSMLENDMISPEDLNLFHMTDDPEAACSFITKIATKRFELHQGAPSACILDWKKRRGDA
ncbi:MAG: Rossman fold protein, TIGR00730 family [Planctomycetes bacterium TMED75]|nr:TIGR00730 family Rossman fold protein [Planctomycetaceae bacterium]OUU96936.1 MAG: Rossman fold protein, TIGR00730 family [Planctomycetes bacterium TMED75]